MSTRFRTFPAKAAHDGGSKAQADLHPMSDGGRPARSSVPPSLPLDPAPSSALHFDGAAPRPHRRGEVQMSRRLTMSRTAPTLGAQFAPTYHRPFLRYFNEEHGAAGAPPAAPAAATPPAAPAAPAPVPTPPPAAVAPPAPAPAAPPAQPEPIQYRGNPDEYVRELRDEARGHRQSFENEQTAHTATKAELATAQSRTTSLERENFVLRNAGKFGGNADALLDSNSFMTAFAGVDLSDEAAVKTAFETALEKNSALKAGPGLPSMSGVGPQGGATPATPVTLAGAVAKALGG